MSWLKSLHDWEHKPFSDDELLLLHSAALNAPRLFAFHAAVIRMIHSESRPELVEQLRAISISVSPPREQRVPGRNLRRIAKLFFSAKSYSTVLEPTLSDLAEEHALAVAEQRPWRARYIRLRGCWSFWAAVATHLVAALGRQFSKLWARARESEPG
jgi:hypothetical protein